LDRQTRQRNATRAVRQQLGEGWDLRLTDYVLDREYAKSLEMTHGRVRRIKYGKGFS
jgi:hypothetical protein